MGDIKYQTEEADYIAPPVLAFRGPPYGVVTDFILARGWARTRREAEIRLLYITLVCIGIVAGMYFLMPSAVDTVPAMSPEQAATLQVP